MRYPALRPESAITALEALRSGREPTMSAVETRGTGPELSTSIVEALAGDLIRVKERYPKAIGQRDPTGGRYEAEACPLVHEAVPKDAEMLADYDFWTWLAVVATRDIVEWRHGGKAGVAAGPNFGIGKRDENLLYRMWLRADMGFQDGMKDPYELARRGDQDFWRSHVFRQGYSSSRTLVRALVGYQFPGANKPGPTLKTLEIRDLAKRLRRVHANLMFEALDLDGARAVVEREAAAAKQAIETGGKRA